VGKRMDVVSRGESYGEPEIVCPWCGYVDRDSWEWEPSNGPGGEGDGTHECGECEREFLVSRNISVSYSSRKS
jgi:hypothetical protein